MLNPGGRVFRLLRRSRDLQSFQAWIDSGEASIATPSTEWIGNNSKLKTNSMTRNKTTCLASNIDRKGRLFRAGGSVIMATAATLLWSKCFAVAAGFAVVSAFLALEAALGWCALRACGVKTKF